MLVEFTTRNGKSCWINPKHVAVVLEPIDEAKGPGNPWVWVGINNANDDCLLSISGTAAVLAAKLNAAEASNG